jgi:hypothetical protein
MAQARQEAPMKNILLVEPDYRSKFPPLGLLRISALHKARGDSVNFTRGCHERLQSSHWHRIYVSSLFTWELPRTVRTIQYYLRSVAQPENLFVGGVGATLMPDYIKSRAPCTVICGPVDRKGILGPDMLSLEKVVPDYSVLDSTDWDYQPKDAYFCRTTKGCIRGCKFCAVPRLEPKFSRYTHWREEIKETRQKHGERQNLVLMDNNVLANDNVDGIIRDIRNEGFEHGAKLNRKLRSVDFNQGIDARLVTLKIADALATINLRPIRLAFDYDGVEKAYRTAVARLAKVGFRLFTNYVMFNFNDTPDSLYRRMKINLSLSREHDVAITGFPMRYIPITDINRQHVSSGWKWRYLRGIQCVLLATHGMVSPDADFFAAAFGESYQEFLEILSMPDRYIVHREKYKANRTKDWRKLFRRLTDSTRTEFLGLLAKLNGLRDKKVEMKQHGQFRELLEHYYPHGRVPRE